MSVGKTPALIPAFSPREKENQIRRPAFISQRSFFAWLKWRDFKCQGDRYHFQVEKRSFAAGQDARLYGRQGCPPLHFLWPGHSVSIAIANSIRYENGESRLKK
jgi:hypothetical protein